MSGADDCDAGKGGKGGNGPPFVVNGFKEFSGQLRAVDQAGCRLRAAAFPVDLAAGKILVIRSLRHPERWGLPGGGLEDRETPEEAAVRETEEEAGARTRVIAPLGEFKNELKGHRTMWYVSAVKEVLEEGYEEAALGRQRRFVTIDELPGAVKHRAYQAAVVKAFLAWLPTNRQVRDALTPPTAAPAGDAGAAGDASPAAAGGRVTDAD